MLIESGKEILNIWTEPDKEIYGVNQGRECMD